MVYKQYVADVPRVERQPCDPQTPNKNRNYSRRDFDTHVKNWKRSLHRWEECLEKEKALPEDFTATDLCKAFEDFELISYSP